MIFQNRLQNYTFLRTQPNKMHKNERNVHILFVLCIIRILIFSYFTTIFLPSQI